MQKTLPILGLFAILIVGMTSPAMAEYDQWEEKYQQLAEEFEEKRHQIERHFEEEFEELDREYEEKKMEIYEKIENNPELSDSEINAMFDELFLEFDEERRSLELDMMKQFHELDEMLEKEFRQLDEESREYYEEQRADGEFYENDPEWESIEPMVNKIMEVVPPEKIQKLWEAGEIEQLIELIVSETDFTYDQVKRIVMFFEKYDNRDDGSYDTSEQYPEHDYPEYDYPEHDYPEYDYPEHDYPEYDYPEPYPVPGVDNEQVLRLEQRISELEEENQMLRDTIEELEEKITQINAVLMEQVKFIYEWVSTQ
ncbi:hypothetical protein AAA799B03_00340 [Marine Group I thaumarchaeote SCGC AAA799-B03]|uniref:Uncharacterized protein n=1 Tax=Marine Group I thaumarchaeote SCGC AAA799-B03 TaxID=1502289 RepID=A0A087S8N8_9ARCH|nr:hypothetical protein AAA799B03_00340 [Marine Group I thaumarchaeote SCGC AAA799-B03]